MQNWSSSPLEKKIKLWVKLTKYSHATYTQVKGQGHTEVLNINNITLHVVSWWYTHIWFVLCVKEQRRFSLDTNSWWKYNLILKPCKGHEFMWYIVHGDTRMCQICCVDVKRKNCYGPNTKRYHKPYRFDRVVKCQLRIEMNVRDTSSYGERTMYQIWYANVKANRSYGSDMRPCF